MSEFAQKTAGTPSSSDPRNESGRPAATDGRSGARVTDRETAIMVPLDRLEPNPEQARRSFTDGGVARMSDSIAVNGMVQALVVRRKGEKFQILCGERRYRGAHALGLEHLPCVVREASDEDALVLSVVENLERERLSSIDLSDALTKHRMATGLSWEETAKRFGIAPGRARDLNQLQRLAEPVREAIRDRRLSERKARPLAALPMEQQVELMEQALREGWAAEAIRARVAEIRRAGAEV